MTITSYYVKQQTGADAEAMATIHLINDLAYSSGDYRSWDATRALVDSMLDTVTQDRLGICIEAEQSELAEDD